MSQNVTFASLSVLLGFCWLFFQSICLLQLYPSLYQVAKKKDKTFATKWSKRLFCVFINVNIWYNFLYISLHSSTNFALTAGQILEGQYLWKDLKFFLKNIFVVKEIGSRKKFSRHFVLNYFVTFLDHSIVSFHFKWNRVR